MSEDARQRTCLQEPVGAADAIGDLAMALAAYLDEVHGEAAVCERHDEAARVHATRRALHIHQVFPWEENTVRQLEQAAASLPGWERSLFWQLTRAACRSLKGDAARGKAGGVAERALLCRGVAWEGRPVLLCAFGQSEGRLHLEVLLPRVPAVPPELPLRAVASALRCHEHLLPLRIARPLRREEAPRPGTLSPLAFLTRAMPPHLYASQWISHLGTAT